MQGEPKPQQPMAQWPPTSQLSANRGPQPLDVLEGLVVMWKDTQGNQETEAGASVKTKDQHRKKGPKVWE